MDEMLFKLFIVE